MKNNVYMLSAGTYTKVFRIKYCTGCVINNGVRQIALDQISSFQGYTTAENIVYCLIHKNRMRHNPFSSMKLDTPSSDGA